MLIALLCLLSLPRHSAAALSHETIVEGARKCCPPDPAMQRCCVKKLQNRSARIGCPTPEWQMIGGCLEKFFWNTTVIEQNVFRCCDLLHSSLCRRVCSFTFRAPDIPPSARHYSASQDCTDAPEVAEDCLKDSVLKRHACFGECVRLRLAHPPDFHFDPLAHCPRSGPATRNGCIGPATLLH